MEIGEVQESEKEACFISQRSASSGRRKRSCKFVGKKESEKESESEKERGIKAI